VVSLERVLPHGPTDFPARARQAASRHQYGHKPDLPSLDRTNRAAAPLFQRRAKTAPRKSGGIRRSRTPPQSLPSA
jgi:hypothetical protein